jgi:hypothetical protein
MVSLLVYFISTIIIIIINIRDFIRFNSKIMNDWYNVNIEW